MIDTVYELPGALFSLCDLRGDYRGFAFVTMGSAAEAEAKRERLRQAKQAVEEVELSVDVEEKRPPLSPGKSPSAVRGQYRSLETEKDKGSSTPGGGNGKRGGDGSFLAMVFVVYVLVALMNRLFHRKQRSAIRKMMLEGWEAIKLYRTKCL